MRPEWPHRPLAAVPKAAADIEELASSIRISLGQSGDKPCDLASICLYGGFFRKVLPLRARVGGHEALLVPRRDRDFDLLVDEDPPPEFLLKPQFRRSARGARRRVAFRTAHEIGHSFFYNRDTSPPRRIPPNGSKAEEAFCNAFASFLLVPPSAVRSCAGSMTAEVVAEVSARYDVALQTAAIALTREAPDVTVVALAFADHPKSGTALRTLWSTGSIYVPRASRLMSRIADSARQMGTATDLETLDKGPVRGTYDISAALVDKGGDVVIAVLRPSSSANLNLSRSSSRQLSLV